MSIRIGFVVSFLFASFTSAAFGADEATGKNSEQADRRQNRAESVVNRMFQRLDKDGNGAISKDEMKQSVLERYGQRRADSRERSRGDRARLQERGPRPHARDIDRRRNRDRRGGPPWASRQMNRRQPPTRGRDFARRGGPPFADRGGWSGGPPWMRDGASRGQFDGPRNRPSGGPPWARENWQSGDRRGAPGFRPGGGPPWMRGRETSDRRGPRGFPGRPGRGPRISGDSDVNVDLTRSPRTEDSAQHASDVPASADEGLSQTAN